ncbi:TetR/AcrR family transcriptional regulator [Desulfatiferula olefinivorans]
MSSSILKQLREDEREARKSLILDAVLKLFERKPFDEIGMRDIAAEAGVSPAAIYRYFPSQEELFMEAFIKDLSSIRTAFQESLNDVSRAPASVEPLEEMARAIVDHLIHNEATFQMMSYLMIKGNMPDYLLTRFQALQTAFIDKIIQVFKLSGIEDPDRTLSHAFISSVMGTLMTFRNYPGKDIDNAEEHIHLLAGRIARIFKKGITD